MRFSGAFAVLFGLALGVSACGGGGGGGYSTEEATKTCELEANKPCSDATTTQQCVTCYEECGTNCAVLESCPVQYACPVE